ncbi:MAG: hypothetical protein KME26_32840 [Oscillatoria princeps RMCB-10]|nr:hypothetical protein [Oscillatoria princeps RMCB-10]
MDSSSRRSPHTSAGLIYAGSSGVAIPQPRTQLGCLTARLVFGTGVTAGKPETGWIPSGIESVMSGSIDCVSYCAQRTCNLSPELQRSSAPALQRSSAPAVGAPAGQLSSLYAGLAPVCRQRF